MSDGEGQGTGEGQQQQQQQGAGSAALDAGTFYEKFENADLKTYAANFKSAEEAVARAHKFDAFKDHDPANIVALPEKIEKLEDLAPILSKYAAKDVAEYGFDKLEGVDAEFAGAMGKMMLETGTPPALAAKLAEGWQAYVKAEAENSAKAAQAEAKKEVDEFSAEIGAEGMEMTRRVKRYAVAKGFSEQAIATIEANVGAGDLLRLFHIFSPFLKEGEYVDGEVNKKPDTLLDRWYGS